MSFIVDYRVLQVAEKGSSRKGKYSRKASAQKKEGT
jgi:hypothetical protein